MLPEQNSVHKKKGRTVGDPAFAVGNEVGLQLVI
jgi:hypothetical protein